MINKPVGVNYKKLLWWVLGDVIFVTWPLLLAVYFADMDLRPLRPLLEPFNLAMVIILVNFLNLTISFILDYVKGDER